MHTDPVSYLLGSCRDAAMGHEVDYQQSKEGGLGQMKPCPCTFGLQDSEKVNYLVFYECSP